MDEKTLRLMAECEAELAYDSVIESHTGSRRPDAERLPLEVQDQLRRLLGSPK